MRVHLVLLSFFIPLCFISFNIYVATCQCLGQQQFSLLQMRHNFVVNPVKSKKLVHWNQSGDCCQWNGIACNKGHVIGVDLSEEFITGGLNNSSLFNLQYLQNLNLAYNEFHSFIPTELGLLKNLRYLNLSNAGFKGQIPIEIAHLTKLATLDLSTSFTSEYILKLEKPNIGMLLQNLTEITQLYLDGVWISTVGKEWCHALSSLKMLQILSMSSCNLSGPIDSSLSKLQSLSVIQLSLNNMSSPVPKSLADLSSLTTLQLRGCGMIGIFPKDIFHLHSLKVLDISDNQYLGGSLPNFPQDGCLQTFNLSYTNFSGKLPSSISNLKQLSLLDLSSCHFNGTIPTSFSGLTQLVRLDLSFNYFTGPLPSLTLSKDLKYLSVFQNDLTGPIESIHWEELLNLIHLNLGDNSLNGKVPSTLFTLTSLQELILSHNGFDGSLDEFPNSSFSTLKLVDLSSNKLQGSIPMSFLHLRSLGYLYLTSNQFNGSIKLDMFRALQKLHTLGLSDNNLSVDGGRGLSSFHSMTTLSLAGCKLRELPAFLRNQSKLFALDLSSNQIPGIIPNWIWGFHSMVALNLSNNFLTGLEGPLDNLTSNVFDLDLHSNQLGGSIPIFSKNAFLQDFSNNRFNYIPPDIAKYLHFTNSINLSNNRFHGNIPQTFCDCPALRMLDLSHNGFNGSIPNCLMSRRVLKALNLVGNKLSGSISDTISSSCDFRFHDLSGNLLRGKIPKTLENCQRLQVLNLGNNVLSDKFPCFLGNISTLRLLILRSNKLYGPIECQHNNSTGGWDMLHIVDLASNNFTGALPRLLFQSWTAMMHVEAREKPGNLFFDLYDIHTVRFKDMVASMPKVLAKKLAKMEVGIEPSTVENLFSDVVNSYQLQYGGTYLDSVSVVSKGLQMNFVKILLVFSSLDLSSNHFEGPIPGELMSLRTLNVLNLSHNTLSDHIPSSLGNLKQMESLDLSNNTLSGEIPIEIASLSFLSVLKLSYNHLVGKIPTGTQIQTFEAGSFEGNEGLCGPPLTKNCNNDDDEGQGLPTLPSFEKHSSIDWNFLSVELGFTFGLGCVILPIIFLKRWRLWYSKHVEDLLYKIFPQLDFVYEHHGGKRYRTLRWR